MNFLEEKILSDGNVKQGNILKIDNFLNHQIDIDIIRQIAYELKRRFRVTSGSGHFVTFLFFRLLRSVFT